MSNVTQTPNPEASAAQVVELSEILPQNAAGPNLIANNLALLNGLKVSLSVMVGEVHTTLGELLSLKESSVLKVDRLADYPVDVIVNGSIVARGQLVVVDDNFGVRVTEIANSGKP